MKPKPKLTAEQEYFARKRNHSVILAAARAQAMQREYQLLKSTPLKDLIGKKLHVL